MVAETAHDAARPRYRIISELLQGLRDNAPDHTIEACTTLLAQDPESDTARFAIGVTATAMGDLATGVAMLDAAHQADPDEPLYAEALAVVYALAGQLGECVYFGKLSAALGCNEAVQALFPPCFPCFTDAYLLISERPLLAEAEQHFARHQFARAADRYTQQLAFEPGCVAARRGLARSRLKLAEPWAAAEALRPQDLSGQGADTSQLEALDYSLAAEASAALGDATQAQVLHARAQNLAPDDPDIAARALRDSVLYPDLGVDELTGALAGWAERFAKAGALRFTASPGSVGKLRIGYLFSALADPRDRQLLAQAVAGHDQARFEIFAYAKGEETDPENSGLLGRFRSWRDCAGLDAATLAMTLSSDRIDVAIDCSGLLAPAQLLALAGKPARLRLSWLGNPAGITPELFDGALFDSAPGNNPLRIAPAAPAGEPKKTQASLEFCYGATVSIAQLHPDLCAAWSEILRATPDATLLLNGPGLSNTHMVQGLLQRFMPLGVADRIDVLDLPSEEFHGLASAILAPFAAHHAWAEAEALAHGVPVVALAGDAPHRRFATGMLHDAGLTACVCTDVADYVAKARELAQSQIARAHIREGILSAHAHSSFFRPSGLALAIEQKLSRSLGAAL